VTDAHCHPTDLDQTDDVYTAVQLGGLASMATVIEDQEKVEKLSQARPWLRPDLPSTDRALQSPASSSITRSNGPRIVACYGKSPVISPYSR